MLKKNIIVLTLILFISLIGLGGILKYQNTQNTSKQVLNVQDSNIMLQFSNLISTKVLPRDIIKFLENNARKLSQKDVDTIISKLLDTQKQVSEKNFDKLLLHNFESSERDGCSEKYLYYVTDSYCDKKYFREPTNLETIKHEKTKKLIKDFNEDGLRLFIGHEYYAGFWQNVYFTDTDYEKLSTKFGKYISPQVLQGLRFLEEDREKPAWVNEERGFYAHLLISPDEFVERLIKLEKFINENPDSIITKKVINLYNQYMDYFFTDYEFKLLTSIENQDKAQQKAISLISNEHPESKTAEVLKEFLQLIKQENSDIEAFTGTFKYTCFPGERTVGKNLKKSLSPDERYLVLVSVFRDGNVSEVTLQDLKANKSKVIYKDTCYEFKWSDDSNYLYFLNKVYDVKNEKMETR